MLCVLLVISRYYDYKIIQLCCVYLEDWMITVSWADRAFTCCAERAQRKAREIVTFAGWAWRQPAPETAIIVFSDSVESKDKVNEREGRERGGELLQKI
jgi:hypothetical protein